MRPPGQKAITVAVGNFKGGVSKTTSAMILAQGLSLRGHRVLAIDTDPQGSLTTLHGILPETEVDAEMTIGPLCEGSETDIRYAIRSTYWEGIDLIAAAPFLFSAEFALPARQMRDPSSRFWDVLNAGLDSVRDLYDVIVIDTPPSLSYVTINALWAADGEGKVYLLDCSHMYHKCCLESFERFDFGNTLCCPMCRHANYQKKLINL
jgi:chromosome partitioning protein